MCPGYGGVCASTRCSGEPPCRPDEKIGVSCRRPRRPSRVVRVVSVLFCGVRRCWLPHRPDQRKRVRCHRRNTASCKSIALGLHYSTVTDCLPAMLPPPTAIPGDFERPRSCNNRSVYSSNRWGRNVRTVAAIVPELDPKTDRIGNWSSADWRASYPKVTLAVLSGGSLVESDVLATPKW